jgi:hypothetical protein
MAPLEPPEPQELTPIPFRAELAETRRSQLALIQTLTTNIELK